MPDLRSAPLVSLPLQPQQSFAAGQVLGGKYRIDGMLGAGGMGVVLAATHLDLDAPVAIKVLRDELLRSEEIVARMLMEARAAAKMRGAHVVRVLDVARLESGAPYIVMERLEGSDLAAVLQARGALPMQEAVDYVLQACEGLAEAHAAGIIHRDLKPENLFLAQTPEGLLLKILDFGISKDLGSSLQLGPRSVLTNAGCAVGSPYYMSPEQMRASLKVDGRTDIWSLGAMLYELLKGKCPFEGDSLPEVCAKVLADEPEPLFTGDEEGPAQLAAIVHRCLRKNPNDRFGTVTELATALRDFASAEGQRAADRSARFASGVNLKSDQDRRRSTPVYDAARSPACSWPTLPSHGMDQATTVPVPSHASSAPSAPVQRRRKLPVLLLLGGALCVVGTVAWQVFSPPPTITAQARSPVVVAPEPPLPSPTVAALPPAPAVQPVAKEPPRPVSTKPRSPASRAVAKIAAPVAPASATSMTPVSSAHETTAPAAGSASSARAAGAPAVVSLEDRLGGRY